VGWGCLGVGWGFYVGVVVGLGWDMAAPLALSKCKRRFPSGMTNKKSNCKNKQQQQPIQWSIRCAQDDESIGNAGFCKNKQQQRQIQGFLHCAALRSK